MILKILLIISALEACCLAVRTGFEGYNQDWGYVDTREGCHMFWWLHYTLATVPEYTDRPLIFWLQGGPGSSSTGYGNFEILGPLDLDLKFRDFTWINTHNVLFVDNPVGTGFSYVDHKKYLTTDNKQIARDLVELLRGFYDALPEFKTVPLHIFGESYGGKMAVEFAKELHEEIENGKIESNLVTVAMGDAWISPIDSTLSWAPYLLQLGFVDIDGFKKIDTYAKRTQKVLNEGKFYQATDLWYLTEVVLQDETHGVDFYNVLYDTPASNSVSAAKQLLLSPRDTAFNTMVRRSRINPSLLKSEDADEEDSDSKLTRVMRTLVHPALGIPDHVKWGSQAGAVFDTLAGDFMKDVIYVVEDLLNNTSIQVVVYSGQLDLICATPGTVEWIHKMKWHGSKEYAEAPRDSIGVNNVLEGYSRKFENFMMYWINKAGHMAPFDNPRAMGQILREITNYG